MNSIFHPVESYPGEQKNPALDGDWDNIST